MLTIFCDGASKKNPGVCGIGGIINQNSKTIAQISEMIGDNYTNNVAEYCSVYRVLSEVLTLTQKPHPPISIIMDSELVVKQLQGEYKVKQEKLSFLNREVQQLIEKNNLKVSFVWVPREQNSMADKLANDAITNQIKSSSHITNLLNKLNQNSSTASSNSSNTSNSSSNQNENKNQNLNSSTKLKSQNDNSGQQLIAERVFFSKTSCLKFQISKRKEMYFHIGKLQSNSWDWKIIKCSDVEVAQICSLIQGKENSCAFFHKNSHKGANTSTQIWCNMTEKGLSIKIQNNSKLLSTYEADVLYELMRRGIWEINKF